MSRNNLLNMQTRTVAQRLIRGGIDFKNDPGLTEQSHKDSCDINRIMANYETTGLLPMSLSGIPTYGDFLSANTYHDACNLVIASQEAFDSLPAKVRSQFDNDPALFMSAVSDPSKRAFLESLGLDLSGVRHFSSDGSEILPDSSESVSRGSSDGEAGSEA